VGFLYSHGLPQAGGVHGQQWSAFFCWQTFPDLGRAQIFVGRLSEVSDGLKFLLADFLPPKLAGSFCWQTFYHRNLPVLFVGRLSTTETCLLFMLASFLPPKPAGCFLFEGFLNNTNHQAKGILNLPRRRTVAEGWHMLPAQYSVGEGL